jgi:hypothetical protein
MLISEFIPCIDLDYMRSNSSDFDDYLSQTLSDSNFNLMVSSGKEEYDKVLSTLGCADNSIINKSHMRILIELVAGTLTLNFNEKMKILTEIFNENITEKQELILIEQLEIEKERWFAIYTKHQALKKLFNLSNAQLKHISDL